MSAEHASASTPRQATIESAPPVAPHPKSNRIARHLSKSLAPLERCTKQIMKNFHVSSQDFKGKKLAMAPLRLLRGCLTSPLLLGIAIAHTVTHVTGVAQLASKVDGLLAKCSQQKGIGYAAMLLRVASYIPAVLLNFDKIGEAAIFGSSKVRHWDFFNSNSPEKIEKSALRFDSWLNKEESFCDEAISQSINVDEGVVLDGYLLKPKLKEGIVPKGLVIYQPGNGGNYENENSTKVFENYLKCGYAVIAYNRRGCMKSGGSPSEERAIADCRAVVAHANSLLNSDGSIVAKSDDATAKTANNFSNNSHIILHGHSLGGLIAAKACESQDLDGVRVILDRTGTSLQAAKHLVPSFLMQLNYMLTGARFEITKVVEALADQKRLIIIKSSKEQALGKGIDYEDEVFGAGEIALYGKVGEQFNDLQKAMILENNAEKFESKKEDLKTEIESLNLSDLSPQWDALQKEFNMKMTNDLAGKFFIRNFKKKLLVDNQLLNPISDLIGKPLAMPKTEGQAKEISSKITKIPDIYGKMFKLYLAKALNELQLDNQGRVLDDIDKLLHQMLAKTANQKAIDLSLSVLINTPDSTVQMAAAAHNSTLQETTFEAIDEMLQTMVKTSID